MPAACNPLRKYTTLDYALIDTRYVQIVLTSLTDCFRRAVLVALARRARKAARGGLAVQVAPCDHSLDDPVRVCLSCRRRRNSSHDSVRILCASCSEMF